MKKQFLYEQCVWMNSNHDHIMQCKKYELFHFKSDEIIMQLSNEKKKWTMKNKNKKTKIQMEQFFFTECEKKENKMMLKLHSVYLIIITIIIITENKTKTNKLPNEWMSEKFIKKKNEKIPWHNCQSFVDDDDLSIYPHLMRKHCCCWNNNNNNNKIIKHDDHHIY